MTSLTSGCLDNQCDQIDGEPVRYTDGLTNSSRTFYQSSAPDEPFLRFPAARNFHMEHGLGDMPVDVSVFLSFEDNAKPHSLAAGDEALLTIERDYIGVRNNTCADFFIRVTAWSQPRDEVTVETDSSPTDAGGQTLPAFDAAALRLPALFVDADVP